MKRNWKKVLLVGYNIRGVIFYTKGYVTDFPQFNDDFTENISTKEINQKNISSLDTLFGPFPETLAPLAQQF